jgi:hypothetical protein
MLRSNLLFVCALTAACFAACGDDESDGDGSGGAAGDNPNGGTSGEAGAPSGGTATGGKGGATGGTRTGGTGGGPGGEPGAGAGMGGDSGAAGMGGEGGAACVPTEPPDERCDDVDNDCNGEIDDIDVGNDGIRDCLAILLIGAPGQFSSSNFQVWLEEQGAATVSRIHESGTAAALTNADLQAFDIAILDNLIRDYTPEESEVLSQWVRSGRGLMSLNGHTGVSDRTRGNSLLLELGVEHVAELRSATVTTFHAHPLTTGLTSLTFSGGYRLGNLPSGEGSVVVAEITDGAVGLALVRGSGRAFVWGDEWVEFDSEWQSLPEVKTFWINALSWLSGTR